MFDYKYTQNPLEMNNKLACVNTNLLVAIFVATSLLPVVGPEIHTFEQSSSVWSSLGMGRYVQLCAVHCIAVLCRLGRVLKIQDQAMLGYCLLVSTKCLFCFVC